MLAMRDLGLAFGATSWALCVAPYPQGMRVPSTACACTQPQHSFSKLEPFETACNDAVHAIVNIKTM